MRQSPFPYGNPIPKRVRTGVLMAIVIGVTLLMTVLAAVFERDGDTEEFSATLMPEVVYYEESEPTQVPQPVAAVTVESVNPSGYAGIRKSFSDLSTNQWTTYARSLVGEYVEWTGVVAEVHSDLELWITLDAPASQAVPQAALHLGEPVSNLAAGDSVNFAGFISRIVVIDKEILVHIKDGQVLYDRSR